MNSADRKSNYASDDIDLLLLVERSMQFVKSYKWVFLFALAAGIAAGTYFYLSAARVYKSQLLLRSSVLSNPEQIAMIQNWNKLLKSRQYQSLAESFRCNEALLASVKGFKASELEKIFVPVNPNGFVLEVTVSDNTIWKELEKGIVCGLGNTTYAQSKVAAKKETLAELIAKTDKGIWELDSAKLKLEKIINDRGRNSPLIIDGGDIYQQSVDMHEKLARYKEDLKFSDAVQVLQGFTPTPLPVTPGRFVLLAISIIACLCIAYIVALGHSINSKLKARKQVVTNTED